MPFGIKCAQDVFQRKINEAFEGLSNATCIVDDLILLGKTREEHDQVLTNVLTLARSKGVRFNPEKCVIGATEVPFFGHIISSTGLKPDPKKIEAIMRLEIPNSRAKLENFLGMVNYLGKFAPNLAEVTSPLRCLLKKDIEFLWDEQQNKAFNQVRDVITSSSVLGYFDPSKPITLEGDASQNGIGSCLMQEGRPLAYASKTLTQAEKGYAQIEKELLAILFRCKRFHQYVYGKSVKVHSDHKPIASIMKKPLSAAPPRLQRMLLQLQPYDIDVVHVSGKHVPISDFLSRQSLPDTYHSLIDGMDLHVHAVIQQLSVTDKRLESVKNAIKSDLQMQTLKQTLDKGWPQSRQDCSKNILEYWNHRDEISCVNGLIFRGQKLLIPRSLRPELLNAVHIGHMGVSKTIERAKDSIFWPGMIKDITDCVLNCPICLTHRDSNPKEPLTPHDIPSRPYQKIGSDIFTFDGKNYLLTTDYYSRFFEVELLPDTRSLTIIRKLKVHMSRNGICEVFISDNGPNYASQEFANFANTWGFEHRTSSPYYPASNGLQEKTVSIVKSLFKKAKDSGHDPYLAILEYRNTPLDCGYSPSQLLLGRRSKSILPTTQALLKPQTINPNIVKEKMIKSKTTQKSYFDKSARALQPLNVDDSVRVQFGKIWKQAKVIKILPNRSYLVQTLDGVVYRRNRRWLNKTNENVSQINPWELNVLADSTPSSTPCEPQYISQPSSQTNTPGHYITRSGREVKTNTRYTSDEWKN